MRFEKHMVKQVKERAARDLAEHVVTVEQGTGPARLWLCKRPRQGVYWFRVTVIPGTCIVTGDMGCCAITRCDDQIAWMRGAIDSIDYFASKVERDCKIKEYHSELAEEFLNDWRHDLEESRGELLTEKEIDEIDEIKRHFSYGEQGGHELRAAVYESKINGYDCEGVPSLEYYTWHFLWIREALKWWLDNAPADSLDWLTTNKRTSNV